MVGAERSAATEQLVLVVGPATGALNNAASAPVASPMTRPSVYLSRGTRRRPFYEFAGVPPDRRTTSGGRRQVVRRAGVVVSCSLIDRSSRRQVPADVETHWYSAVSLSDSHVTRSWRVQVRFNSTPPASYYAPLPTRERISHCTLSARLSGRHARQRTRRDELIAFVKK